MEELSLKVKQKRGGMGIRAAAKEIGISPATLSRIETGKQPDLRSFKLLCEWLNIDPSTALGVRTKVGAPSSQVAPIQAHFRADKAISPSTAQHLANLIIAVNKASETGF